MITSKQQLIDYTLRKLGEPVVNVNVTEEQLSDRLEEALEKFREFHFNGMQRLYISHQLTATDVQNKYITIPDNIIHIARVFPYVEGSATGTSPGDSGLFSVQYQIRLGDLWNINSGNMTYYTSVMQNLALLDQTFNGLPMMRHTQVVDKLYLDAKWGSVLDEGRYIAFEAFVTTNPEEYRKIYDQIWLKEYFAALVKQQWGTNIKKFNGVMLIGGVSIDGQALYEEGTQEVERLEEELREVYEEPPLFFVG